MTKSLKERRRYPDSVYPNRCVIANSCGCGVITLDENQAQEDHLTVVKLRTSSKFAELKTRINLSRALSTAFDTRVHLDTNKMAKSYPTTPDGRYFVHKERLWRCTDPKLDDGEKTRLVKQLMAARRAVKSAKASEDPEQLSNARANVHAAKVALGERGPTWWDDDTDHNQKLIKNTPYAKWWRGEKE